MLHPHQVQVNKIRSIFFELYFLGFTSTPMQQQRQVRFDNRTLAAPPPQMPSLGGYPSLLKQQLRDLVLRRKSLVREEPEDDTLMDFTSNRGSISVQQGGDGTTNANSNVLINAVDQSLKTGIYFWIFLDVSVFQNSLSIFSLFFGERRFYLYISFRL